MGSKMYLSTLAFALSLFFVFASGHTSDGPQTTNTTSSAKPTTTPTPRTSTTTLSPQEDCESRNKSCKDCVSSAKCLWCSVKNTCTLYPAGDILPRSSLCPLSKARWSVCWLNFEALIISMSVIGGALILALVTCICCCCCCKGRKKSKLLAEEIKYEQEKDDRKRKSDDRRSERKEKNDEIRRKYGLLKEDNAYQRFDNA